jgi:hypothetical protein
VVRFAPRPLYPRGKNPPVRIGQEVDGSQNRSGLSGKEINPIIAPVVTTRVKVYVKSLSLTKHRAMKTYWGMEVYIHAFLELGSSWR